MTLRKDNTLTDYCDAVVMLTWSNWKTEPRSNRYHYAVRFAQCLPVIFVQPDLSKKEVLFERTEIENLTLLHIYKNYGREQTTLLNKALVEIGIICPLIWMYNPFFKDFIGQIYSPLMVYHATENYFSPKVNASDEIRQSLKEVLEHVDLLVAVSEGVLASYKENGPFTGKALLLENGCDFSFWSPNLSELERIAAQKPTKKIAFYQGGINRRLDLEMLIGICKSLPDWEIWMCGAIAPDFDLSRIDSEQIRNLKNFGFLNLEKVRELAYQATVAVIPFAQNEITRVSLPLKAFEYAACGLPVVTVPIPALEKYPDNFVFADNPGDFSKAIVDVAETRYQREWIEKRLKTAREQDYDIRFKTLLEELDIVISSKKRADMELNVLVLYDANSLHVSTIKEHASSFSKYSRSRVFYASATHGAVCAIDLSIFDAIIIHYSIRVSLEDHLSPSYAEAVRWFAGYKVLFIQDEYDTTETARCWIEKLGVHAIFTCVPESYIDDVYPKSRFPHLERIRTLTGFVPIGIKKREPKPIAERQIVIGYRGRPLPFYYGDLGREKVTIAQRMKQICLERNIPEDIEWSHEKRIYGDCWYPFVESAKATLGTESGSNVFDDYGEIKKNVERALMNNPSLAYEEIHTRYISAYEGKIKMNQISPRIFEAIALRTALVLFEGNYSGVIQPDIHYIPLKKDFSNIEEVLEKLTDDTYLTALTDRAYTDIILSEKYSYEKFIDEFDNFLSKSVAKRNKKSPLLGLLGMYDVRQKGTQLATSSNYSMVSLSPLANREINILSSDEFPLELKDLTKLIRIWIRQRFPVLYRRTEKYYLFLVRFLRKIFGGAYAS